MKATELIEKLQDIISVHGDLPIVSTGYYGDVDVESVDVGIDKEYYCEAKLGEPSITERIFVRLLPGSEP